MQIKEQPAQPGGAVPNTMEEPLHTRAVSPGQAVQGVSLVQEVRTAFKDAQQTVDSAAMTAVSARAHGLAGNSTNAIMAEERAAAKERQWSGMAATLVSTPSNDWLPN